MNTQNYKTRKQTNAIVWTIDPMMEVIIWASDQVS